MEFQKLSHLYFFITFSLLFITEFEGVKCSSHHHHHHPHHHQHHEHDVNDELNVKQRKLFVFGDSYSDTGNKRKSQSYSWNFPYGITFPGKPTGRFSDGRVLTDYLAKFWGLKTPMAYKFRKYGGKNLENGMNFAHGGSGVFNTLVTDPNMTTQIDLFRNLINDGVFTSQDLNSSVALVTLSGNDYSAYYVRGGTLEGLQGLIGSVTNQLAINLKRIHEMGVRKVIVNALEPIGCLPRSTAVSSFQQCNVSENTAVSFHNLLLQQAVQTLNNETKYYSPFLILDLYSSFTSVLTNKQDFLGNMKFETPLEPCCMGIKSGYSCGDYDEKGEKMYRICDKPQSYFFWDEVHPTQAGWHAVFLALKPTLNQI
jgi:phospholipase/lecithinase/hemolysin